MKQAPRRIAPLAAPSTPPTRLRILVIDDEPLFRELLAVMLQYLGYEPVALAGGREASQYLRENPAPAAILLDVRMEDGSGLELLPQLKSDDRLRAVPVIMVSGYTDRLGILEGSWAVPDCYLRKPFSHRQLATALGRLLPDRAHSAGWGCWQSISEGTPNRAPSGASERCVPRRTGRKGEPRRARRSVEACLKPG